MVGKSLMSASYRKKKIRGDTAEACRAERAVFAQCFRRPEVESKKLEVLLKTLSRTRPHNYGRFSPPSPHSQQMTALKRPLQRMLQSAGKMTMQEIELSFKVQGAKSKQKELYLFFSF